MDNTLSFILNNIRRHDFSVYLHSIKVAQIAMHIGYNLGITASDTNVLVTSALLHDIGKTKIPLEILQKPGALTENEWILMRRHPLFGEAILGYQKISPNITTGVLSHHERFDGHGYPLGLVGEEIPWQGRIIAVADALDAMVSQRPYRDSKQVNHAIQEIITLSGMQFDPYVAKSAASWDIQYLQRILYETQVANF